MPVYKTQPTLNGQGGGGSNSVIIDVDKLEEENFTIFLDNEFYNLLDIKSEAIKGSTIIFKYSGQDEDYFYDFVNNIEFYEDLIFLKSQSYGVTLVFVNKADSINLVEDQWYSSPYFSYSLTCEKSYEELYQLVVEKQSVSALIYTNPDEGTDILCVENIIGASKDGSNYTFEVENPGAKGKGNVGLYWDITDQCFYYNNGNV